MKDFLLPFALTLSTWPTSHYPLVPYYKSCGFFRLRLKNPVTPTLSYAKVNDSARPPPHLRHLLTFSPWLGLSPAHSPLGVGVGVGGCECGDRQQISSNLFKIRTFKRP